MKENKKVSYWELFISFLKVGLFTFGGGYAMIPIIEREVARNHDWLEEREFVDLLTLAQSIPGPISLNAAAFVGYKTRGYRGALSGILGIILPSFVIIILVALFFTSIRHNPIVEAAFKGMRPVVVALIVAPTISLMKGLDKISIGVVAISMALIATHLITPAVLILSSIIAGILWSYHVGKEARK